MTEIENEHYSETVKVNMHIKQLKSWKDNQVSYRNVHQNCFTAEYVLLLNDCEKRERN